LNDEGTKAEEIENVDISKDSIDLKGEKKKTEIDLKKKEGPPRSLIRHSRKIAGGSFSSRKREEPQEDLYRQRKDRF